MSEPTKDELLEFLRKKLVDAESSLRAREQSAETWSGGTTEMWRKVGCRLTKEQRMQNARMEARIAERCRREVLMFQAVIVALEGGEK